MNAVDFVRFAQPPLRLHHNLPLHVEYFCTKRSLIHVDIRVVTESQEDSVVYRAYWNCTVQEVRKELLRISLPRYVAFRPSRHNRFSVYVEKHATIDIWMSRGLSSRPFRKKRLGRGGMVVASDEVVVEVVQPLERPERPMERCYNWMETVLARLPWKPQCPYELGKNFSYFILVPLINNCCCCYYSTTTPNTTSIPTIHVNYYCTTITTAITSNTSITATHTITAVI